MARPQPTAQRCIPPRAAWLRRLVVMVLLVGLTVVVGRAETPIDERTAAVLTATGCLSTQRPEGVAGLVLASGDGPAGVVPPLFPPPQARPTSMVAAAALAMWGVQDPTAAAVAWRLAGFGGPLPPADDEPASRISPLDDVAADKDQLEEVEDKEPVLLKLGLKEAHAYRYLVVRARDVSQEGLAKHARRDLNFAELFNYPARYRGDIVHLTGRLKRLVKLPADPGLENDGVPVIYEGWVFEEQYNSNPYCVIVSELPEGLQPAAEMEQRVAFNGYFFKRYRYKARDGTRDAPLLIGKTLTLRGPVAPGGDGSVAGQMLTGIVIVLLGGTVFLAVGLTWWFRRGDRQVRGRLAETGPQAFVEPTLEAGPGEGGYRTDEEFS